MTENLHLHRRGELADSAFRYATVAAGGIVLITLGAIAITMTKRAWPAFDKMGLDFFTTSRWAPNDNVFGAKAFIFGTLMAAAIALVIAVPVSIGIALFTTQVAPTKWRRPIVYLVDLLAVVPSVVFGLWGVLVFAPSVTGFYNTLHNVITPIVSSLAREVIDTCPESDRDAAFALGATRWEMIRGSVLPHAKGGLVGAVMLGLGRAMGETIAVALVIGSSANISANLFASGDALPAVIANQWGEAEGNYRAALIGLAVTLFAITILINVAANTIVSRSIVKTQGAR